MNNHPNHPHYFTSDDALHLTVIMLIMHGVGQPPLFQVEPTPGGLVYAMMVHDLLGDLANVLAHTPHGGQY